MDKIKNPFSPGAGSPPPELAGRDGVLEQASVLLGRVKLKRPEKSLIMTGLRGVGKTVLLNEMERMALTIGYRTIFVEAHDEKSLALLLVPQLRRVLFDLDRTANLGDKVRRGLAVLKSFISNTKLSVNDFEFSIDIDSERGSADSGDLETDLPNLFVAIAEAAEERNTGVALFIDEIQYLSANELSALIMAMHKMQQKQLPLALIGAGLPILPGLAGDSKSYAERLFGFPNIGPLNSDEAATALRDPVLSVGVMFSEDALSAIYRLTLGYPYFLQEWGYQSWNHAQSSPISLLDIQETTLLVEQRLDENFFRVRFDRLTPREKTYLRAMAELGSSFHRTSDISDVLGVKPTALGPVRASLIKKGMIYSPAYGDMAFSVPLFDQFIKRTITALLPW